MKSISWKEILTFGLSVLASIPTIGKGLDKDIEHPNIVHSARSKMLSGISTARGEAVLCGVQPFHHSRVATDEPKP